MGLSKASRIAELRLPKPDPTLGGRNYASPGTLPLGEGADDYDDDNGDGDYDAMRR